MTKDQEIAKLKADKRELKRAPKQALKDGALGLTRLFGAFAIPGALGEVEVAGLTGVVPFAIGGLAAGAGMALKPDSKLRWLTEPMKAGALGQAGHLGVKWVGGTPSIAMERLFG